MHCFHHITMSGCRYFNAYRIDHILGFFRIWEIPEDCTQGILGHFRPHLPISRGELDAYGIWDIDRCTA
jgi:4-alpha-glucanotransferase